MKLALSTHGCSSCPQPGDGSAGGASAPTGACNPARTVTAVVLLLATCLIFLVKYRHPIAPYLGVAVLAATLWRIQAGAVCLAGALVALAVAILEGPPRHFRGGLRELLGLTLLGLVFLGARAILDLLERQRRTEQRLIAELSQVVERLRESERQQVLAAQSLTERNEQLQAAQEQLVRSERLAALGQFSATVAHELRNPLNVIKLSAHYIGTHLSASDEKVRGKLNQLSQHVDRAGDIITDLLHFSRLPPPRLAPVAVNSLVREVIGALPRSERVTVMWDLGDDLPRAMADSRQIAQAVENTALNALQAMPEGGQLTVATRLDGAWVEIRVRDTGPGIVAADQAQVFEPFYTTKAAGTGLGLPLVREIALSHGGRVSLESEPGQGACFTLALPLAPRSKGSETHPGAAGAAPAREEEDAQADEEEVIRAASGGV